MQVFHLKNYLVGNQSHPATGEQLTAEQAFTTLAYLNVMRFPMTMLGVLIPWVLMTRVSLIRFSSLKPCHFSDT